MQVALDTELGDNAHAFLAECDVIDWRAANVQALARRLAGDEGCEDTLVVAQHCFEWVRDHIKHSSDFQMNPVTCSASEVLEHKTGYCYAKSHLLCALLRANRIPAGLCYQRLSIGETGPPFCLHGLNAIWLASSRWYRVDSRGNRDTIDAQFTPPLERLAFSSRGDGERDIRFVYSKPIETVIEALRSHKTWDDLGSNLPDLP